MSPLAQSLQELQNRDRELKPRLAQLGEMRSGSLVECYRKCGKPNCRCARPHDRGHGPLWMVTHPLKGKTVSKAIPAGPALERTRAQLAEYQRFRELSRELVATNEQICNARLEEAADESSSGDKKATLAGELGTAVEQEIEALLGAAGAGEVDLEAVETALRRRVLRVAARQLQERFNADHSDYTGASRPCACGRATRYVERRAKHFQSVLGELSLERAYYHCSGCGQGHCPRDQTLGLEDASCSPGVQRMIASVGAAVSFEEGSALLRELAGVEVNAKQVERVAEKLGAEIASRERQAAEPLADAPSAPTLYVGVDGTGVPMRPSELSGRSGKQPSGEAKTREVKLCTVWSAESRDAQRLVVIGDGAPWIWNLAGELFPQAIQIVDRFHIKEYLSRLAKSLYGDTRLEAKRWAERRHHELDEGRWKNLLAALRHHAHRSKLARDCVQYLRHNRQRLRYPEFHAQGLCTSSGVVEAGCKGVIGTRLKRTGMHWTLPGANAIIALRCCKLSGRFEDFWEERSHRRKAA